MRHDKLAAWDLEIAKIGEGGGFPTERPFGITCASIVRSDGEGEVYYGHDGDGYAPQMSQEEAKAFVGKLVEMSEDGWMFTTWNGAQFDYHVLAEESGLWEICADLALAHWDPMFQFFCLKGFPVGLQAVSEAMGIEGKLGYGEGMSGANAPQMWSDGQYQEVLDYVLQDSQANLDVALAILEQGGVSWYTKRGKFSTQPLAEPKTVLECLDEIPVADNSWMTNPLKRDSFVEWMDKAYEIPEPELEYVDVEDEPDIKLVDTVEDLWGGPNE
jgi:hypothetical protein